MHDIKDSQEMYLESILRLSRILPYVRSVDLAEDLNVSKPSVSTATQKLYNEKLITIDNKGHIHLEEAGLKIAQNILTKHKVLEHFFRSLGVDDMTAEDDACKIEHAISDETFEYFRKYVESNFPEPPKEKE